MVYTHTPIAPGVFTVYTNRLFRLFVLTISKEAKTLRARLYVSNRRAPTNLQVTIEQSGLHLFASLTSALAGNNPGKIRAVSFTVVQNEIHHDFVFFF